MSSANKKYITNKEAVPVVETDIFEGHENDRFSLGMFSPEDIMSYEPDSIEHAYLKLRSNVYVDQTKMLDDEHRRFDGAEVDSDDERSIHFVVFENLIGKAAVFACMRLIEKRANEENPLPIETFFKDGFSDPVPSNGIEVSRFIVRHTDRRQSILAKRTLMTAGLAYASYNDLNPILAVVEPLFARDLKLMKVPIDVVAQPKIVEEYNDENMGISIDRTGFIDMIGAENLKKCSPINKKFIYWGDIIENNEVKRDGKI